MRRLPAFAEPACFRWAGASWNDPLFGAYNANLSRS